jgi:hypothetical protein
MKTHWLLANSLLWAAAIIASALLNAPSSLSLILLPVLASIFVLTSRNRPTCVSANQ